MGGDLKAKQDEDLRASRWRVLSVHPGPSREHMEWMKVCDCVCTHLYL